MWKVILWACSLATMPCGAHPDISTVQEAYRREEASGAKEHDKQLKILDAKCHDRSNTGLLCEVTFMSEADPDERLYFDIVALAPAEEGWRMASGLCKR